MAERDRAAVDVGLVRVQSQAARDRDRLRREGLVALDDVDLVQRQAGLLQRQTGGGIGPSPITSLGTPATA